MIKKEFKVNYSEDQLIDMLSSFVEFKGLESNIWYKNLQGSNNYVGELKKGVILIGPKVKYLNESVN